MTAFCEQMQSHHLRSYRASLSMMPLSNDSFDSFIKDVSIKDVQGNAAWCRELIELIDHRWFPRGLRTLGPPDDTSRTMQRYAPRPTCSPGPRTPPGPWLCASRRPSSGARRLPRPRTIPQSDCPPRLLPVRDARLAHYAGHRPLRPGPGSPHRARTPRSAPPSLATRRGRVRPPMRVAPSEPRSPPVPLSAPAGCRARRRSAPAPAWPVPGPLSSARRGGASRCRHRSGRERSYRPFIRGTGRGGAPCPTTCSGSAPALRPGSHHPPRTQQR